MMADWRRDIRCYVSPAGRNKIEDWYEGLSAQEKADADEFIKNQRKIKDWARPRYKVLFEGIGELRWQSRQKQHRLIGFFQEEAWIALIGCSHKGKVYKPPDCLETARKRKKHVEEGEVMTHEFDL